MWASASLSLHLYQVVKRTYTSKLSNMRGVPKKTGPDFRQARAKVLKFRQT